MWAVKVDASLLLIREMAVGRDMQLWDTPRFTFGVGYPLSKGAQIFYRIIFHHGDEFII